MNCVNYIEFKIVDWYRCLASFSDEQICGDWAEAAYTELRKKGLAAAGKKASRVAADGLLGVAQESRAAAVVEINSETDFVARNDLFQHLVSQVAKAALLAESSPGSAGEAAVINMEALEVI